MLFYNSELEKARINVKLFSELEVLFPYPRIYPSERRLFCRTCEGAIANVGCWLEQYAYVYSDLRTDFAPDEATWQI